MMGDNTSDDLFLKYQKLASEYSKMRAQITVLKKGVTDEQSKNSELRDMIKEKDQSVRKLETEIESLNFRNQQLAKRIVVLQDELTVNCGNNSGKKNKNKQTTPVHGHGINNSVDNSGLMEILDSELKNKIAENETLHIRLNAIESEYQQKIDETNRQLESLRDETAANQKSIDQSIESQKLIVAKLNEEKEKLEIKLKNCQKDLNESKILVENIEIEAKNLRSKVKFFEESKRIDQNSFNDNQNVQLIGINIPSVLKSNLSNVRKFISDIKTKFIEILSSLSNLHTYMEQRINICSADALDPSHYGMLKRFAEHLHGNAHYLRRIEESFERFHEIMLCDDMSLILLKSNESLSSVLQNFSNYVSYILKLIPYVIFSLSISTSIGGETGAKISQKNEKLQTCAVRCANCFSQIDTYAKLLISQSLSPSNFSAVFKHLMKHINNLHAAFDDIKRAYSAKLILEHELPTVTERIKTTDDCVLSSIVIVVNATAEIYSLIATNYGLFTSDSSLCKIKGKTPHQVTVNPAVIKLKSRASHYMSSLLELQRIPPLSVPYHDAIINQRFIKDSAESNENLTRQLSTVETKLANLEQSKEHWMLEAQLIQVKYERELKKVMELESKIVTGSAASGGISQQTYTTSTSTPSGGSQKSIEMCNEFASSLQSPTASEDKISIGSTTTEDDIPQVTSYLRNRITQLIDNLHNSDSKCVAYHAECVCLQQRLEIIEKEKTQYMENIINGKRSIDELKEELETNIKNYESQLSMMSEHLANMNDKLTNQKDEIDSLKIQQSNNNNKGNRRSRNK